MREKISVRRLAVTISAVVTIAALWLVDRSYRGGLWLSARGECRDKWVPNEKVVQEKIEPNFEI
jgi:hypothetical protein